MKKCSSKLILIIATLDTKGAETQYVKDLIVETGHEVLVMDTGILGTPPYQSDVGREEVAQAAGTHIEELVRNKDKGKAILTMMEGSRKIVQQLYAEGKIKGVIGLGGAQGTEVGTAAMRALPIGFPKLMVSTMASGLAKFGPYVGTKDLMMLHSVADIFGLNVLTRGILTNAVGAIVGMVEKGRGIEVPQKPQIGMTMYGTTTPGCMVAKAYLESKGFEVVVFHANGTGGKACTGLGQVALRRPGSWGYPKSLSLEASISLLRGQKTHFSQNTENADTLFITLTLLW